jgi:hypothetical protein
MSEIILVSLICGSIHEIRNIQYQNHLPRICIVDPAVSDFLASNRQSIFLALQKASPPYLLTAL